MQRRGPATRSPNPAPPMQRLSPGVYRNAQGGLVNSSGGSLPRSNPAPTRQPGQPSQPANPNFALPTATPVQGWNPNMSYDAARLGKGPAIDPNQIDFNQLNPGQYGQMPQPGGFGQFFPGAQNAPYFPPAPSNFMRQPQPVRAPMMQPNPGDAASYAGQVAGQGVGQNGPQFDMSGFVPYGGPTNRY